MTTPAGCAWTGVSNSRVVDGDQRGEGSGTGTVAFSASANPTTSSAHRDDDDRRPDVQRDAGGRAVHLHDRADEPIVVAGGGTGSTTVTAPAGCAWTAVSNNTSWLTVTAGQRHRQRHRGVQRAANPRTTQRTGTITIGGQTFNVTQAGAPCTYTIAPTSQSSSPAAGPGRRR